MTVMHYDLGTALDGQRVFRMLEEHLTTGLAVLGTTGGGKSRFLWQLLREHRRNRRGFVLIDPGDLADDFLADCAQEVVKTGNDGLLKKIHLLQLSPLQMARYDPMRPPHVVRFHPEVRETCLRAWQHTKVQSVAEVFQRKQGQTDFEGMARLQRVLTNVFTAVSTLVNGKRLAVGDALILVDVGHPDHARVFRRVARKLPREILADFETLHAFRRPQDVRTETESTLNRLRSMLGPLMRQMLSGTGAEPALSVQEVVERGDYLIVSVKKTPWTSYDQNVGLAGMVIHDWVEALLNCDREKRRGTTLIIDEAHEFMAPDLPRAQRIIRKYGGGIVLCTQDLVSLRKKELDLAPAVLGLANTIACFRLTWPDDVETMARILFGGNLDFTPLEHDVYQNRGDVDWVKVYERSVSRTQSAQWSHADGSARSRSETVQETKQRTEQRTWADATGTQHATARADASGWNNQQTTSSGDRDTPVLVDGQLKRTLKTGARQQSDAEGTSGSHTDSTTNSVSNTHTDGGSASTSEGTSRGVQEGTQDSSTDTRGGSLGEGVTVSEKLMPMPVVVHDRQKTGALEASVADQLERFGQTIATLPRRRAVLRVREGKAEVIEVTEVRDPFASPQAQMKAVEWLKRRLYQTHAYFFTPSADPDDELRRITDFAGEADEPLVVGEAEAAEEAADAEESPLL